MINSINKSNGPGVYIPPPLFYVLIFILAVFVQKKIPIADTIFQLHTIKVVGIIFLIIALLFLVRSLRQFFQSKNTVILIKPATSLQKTGIYSISVSALGSAYLMSDAVSGSFGKNQNDYERDSSR